MKTVSLSFDISFTIVILMIPLHTLKDFYQTGVTLLYKFRGKLELMKRLIE